MEFLVIDNSETFKKYSQFKSVKDFNNNIEQWMIEYKQHFTTSERIALKRSIRYVAKVPGISIAKINTILAAIDDKANGYEISRATLKRMTCKAMTVKETVRTNMSQSSK